MSMNPGGLHPEVLQNDSTEESEGALLLFFGSSSQTHASVEGQVMVMVPLVPLVPPLLEVAGSTKGTCTK
jgi:hypothetical protein